jgi:hypothetical protein
LNGTLTVDPFRNDTTLRPYPCSPGTYCLTGVGSPDVKTGDFSYAQYCTEGFYCESASSTPRGSGLCPIGFICPRGTATPKPTPKGSYSSLPGTVQAAKCLPGYYAPTIETSTCYPCPPGTSCENEGTYLASVCGPGTYRSTIEDSGIACAACPQGTWSKNYGLRESGECILCGPGIVCTVESMTNPCAHTDLPTPYEPVVNFQGSADFEYNYDVLNRPSYFTYIECLSLNAGYAEGRMDPAQQHYFFGELVPPYIDILGRGAHFRSTDQASVKYSSTAKCYYNELPYGSYVYQRFTDFLGPQYDIQAGRGYQGYSLFDSDGKYYYDGYFGQGSLYVDLPHARQFEPSFNCTRGFQLMNASEIYYDVDNATTTVYTDPNHDPAGISRSIPRGVDVYYTGTCESDRICYSAVSKDKISEATPCTEGFICDQETSSYEEVYYPCRAGYVCDYGTTPDVDLRATNGQFKRICPASFYCGNGIGLGQAYRNACPLGYYCPTGTGDYLIGLLAGDAVNRGLNDTIANPYTGEEFVRFVGTDDVRVISAHDHRCNLGIDTAISLRYEVDWVRPDEDLVNPSLLYLRNPVAGHVPYQIDPVLTSTNDGLPYRSIATQATIKHNQLCARDHKWRLIDQTIARKECDCLQFFYTMITIYRLWKCTGNGILDDLGIGSIQPPYNGGRDYWFSRYNFNQTICKFEDTMNINTTHGAIPFSESWPAVSLSNPTRALDLTDGITLQYTWTITRHFYTYNELKVAVEAEYDDEYEELTLSKRSNLDPFIFDLKKAIEKVEEYGDRLTELVWITSNSTLYSRSPAPGRSDMCECERLTKCPNGTTSALGSSQWTECFSERYEVLRRISIIPSWYNDSTPALSGYLFNYSDFSELTGADSKLSNGTNTYKLGTVKLETFDEMVATVDLTHISYNLTYGSSFRIAVYIDCKPCPARYLCDYTQDPPTCERSSGTTYPTIAQQQQLFDECLQRYKLTSCTNRYGSRVDCSNSTVYNVSTFQEPDLYKCMQIPYFCDAKYWPKQTWKILTEPDTGIALPASAQEQSTYINDPNSKETTYTPGCCSCEPHWMPHFFLDSDLIETGYSDHEHAFVQFTMLAVKPVEITLAVELFHGQYISDFDTNVPDRGDIFIHRPSRADYKPSNPSRAAFMAFVVSSDFADLELPLNLPITNNRNPKEPYRTLGVSGTYYQALETKVLMGRTSDLHQSDPTYEKRYKKRKLDVYLEQLRQFGNLSESFDDFAAIPDTSTLSKSLFAVSDPFNNIYFDSSYWSDLKLHPANNGESSGYIALPYFPFFSNCKGADNYISISKMLETHPDCDLVEYDNTVPVSPYPWTLNVIPNADKCNRTTTPEEKTRILRGKSVDFLEKYHGALFQCYYEEQVDASLTSTRWYEAISQTTLFYLGAEPYKPSDYDPQYTTTDGVTSFSRYWGRGRKIDQSTGVLGTDKSIPVTVSLTEFGQANVIPLHVRLTIKYYQVTKGQKRIVTAEVEYLSTYQCFTITGGGATQQAFLASGIPQCVTDINGNIASTEYLLEIFYQPLAWYELWNYFQFSAPIYIIFMFATGFMGVGLGLLFYAINRVFTRLKRPPLFRGYSFLASVAPPIIYGAILGSIPTMLAVTFVYYYFLDPADGGTVCSATPDVSPSSMCLENIYDFQFTALGDYDAIINLRNGRKMVALVAIGAYALVICSIIIFPHYKAEDMKPDSQRNRSNNAATVDEFGRENQEEEDEEAFQDLNRIPSTTSWKPHRWRRMNWMMITCILMFCMLIHMEFSYSNPFSNFTYYYFIFFKAIYFIIENNVIEHYIGDKLGDTPLIAVTNVVSNMATMGAADFAQFLLSWVVGLLINFVERFYISPLVMRAIVVYPKYEYALKRLFRRRQVTKEEKIAEELQWRQICEEVEITLDSNEMMIDSFCDYGIDGVGASLGPLTYICLLLFYSETKIAPNYGILRSQMPYYIGFAAIVIPFSFFTDVLVLNTLELIHGWKYYDFVQFQAYRFSVREHRWSLRNPNTDQTLSEYMQSVDLMCFSSQYYFVMALLAFALVVAILGIEGIMRLQYNPFGDPAFLLIFMLTIIIGECTRPIFQFLSDVKIRRLNWYGLWAIKSIHGTLDDDVRAKLTADDKVFYQDFDQDRVEYAALNSERFRHQFLEKNRPWIFQHLIEILSPESLDRPGPDGRPTIEYVKDVYAKLQEKNYRDQKRYDISSSSDDDQGRNLEAQRRTWPRAILSGAAKYIAKNWLAKARKRRIFAKFVAPVIDKNIFTECENCGRNPNLHGVKLTCYLANANAQPDRSVLDLLIRDFEEQYSINESNSNLWIAFFRAHAKFCTRCSVCDDEFSRQHYQEDAAGSMAAAIMKNTTRPQDISSDEEEEIMKENDAEVFEPLIVTSTSIEGRMMNKWLESARKKLGGNFPRADARRQMEKYASHLRQLKMKKGKEIFTAKISYQGDLNDRDRYNESTVQIAENWILKARQSIEHKFRVKSEVLREDLTFVLQAMKSSDDWYYTPQMRLDGQKILQEFYDLKESYRVYDAQANVKIQKIRDDLESFTAEQQQFIAHEQQQLIASSAELFDRLTLKIQDREAELQLKKSEKKGLFSEIEKKMREEYGAAPTELIQSHRNMLLEIDQLMEQEKIRLEKHRDQEIIEAKNMHEKICEVKQQEIARRAAVAKDNVDRIKEELVLQEKTMEFEWQQRAAKYLLFAKRKVEIKKQEDEEAKVMTSKKKESLVSAARLS